jgi:hypothetical protein
VAVIVIQLLAIAVAALFVVLAPVGAVIHLPVKRDILTRNILLGNIPRQVAAIHATPVEILAVPPAIVNRPDGPPGAGGVYHPRQQKKAEKAHVDFFHKRSILPARGPFSGHKKGFS